MTRGSQSLKATIQLTPSFSRTFQDVLGRGRSVSATKLRRPGRDQIIRNAPLGPQPCCKTHATASAPNLGNWGEHGHLEHTDMS